VKKTLLFYGALAVVALLLLWWLSRKGTDLAAAIADPDNPVNSAVEDFYQGATGSEGTPGSDLYDLGHDSYGNRNALGWLLDVLTGQTALSEQTERLNAYTEQTTGEPAHDSWWERFF